MIIVNGHDVEKMMITNRLLGVTYGRINIGNIYVEYTDINLKIMSDDCVTVSIDNKDILTVTLVSNKILTLDKMGYIESLHLYCNTLTIKCRLYGNVHCFRVNEVVIDNGRNRYLYNLFMYGSGVNHYKINMKFADNKEVHARADIDAVELWIACNGSDKINIVSRNSNFLDIYGSIKYDGPVIDNIDLVSVKNGTHIDRRGRVPLLVDNDKVYLVNRDTIYDILWE